MNATLHVQSEVVSLPQLLVWPVILVSLAAGVICCGCTLLWFVVLLWFAVALDSWLEDEAGQEWNLPKYFESQVVTAKQTLQSRTRCQT